MIIIDWNPVTYEDALKGNALEAYSASKALSEREVWKFADAHPEIETTTCASPRELTRHAADVLAQQLTPRISTAPL